MCPTFQQELFIAFVTVFTLPASLIQQLPVMSSMEKVQYTFETSTCLHLTRQPLITPVWSLLFLIMTSVDLFELLSNQDENMHY